MLITVAICTWNRADLLDQTLARLGELVIPDGVSWELLVVDNNSTDRTATVIDKHVQAARLPIRPLFEPQQGHARARNRALAEVRGELLLWTDDDVLVSPNWLSAYVEASRQYPDASYFGGPIKPWFPVPPPKWFSRNVARLGPYWALLERSGGTRLLRRREHVFGANMCFRTDVIRHRPFDVRTGHVGSRSGGFDDTNLQDSLQDEGGTGVWVADASVMHYVIPDRMNLNWLWQHLVHVHYRRKYSATDYDGQPRFLGAPRWLIKQYWLKRLELALRSLNRDGRWVDAFLQAAEFRGLIAAARNEER